MPEWILVLLLPPLSGLLAAALGWAICWREKARENRPRPAMPERDEAQ
jgi:hypothetical protein